jgi:hypothetical protein
MPPRHPPSVEIRRPQVARDQQASTAKERRWQPPPPDGLARPATRLGLTRDRDPDCSAAAAALAARRPGRVHPAAHRPRGHPLHRRPHPLQPPGRRRAVGPHPGPVGAQRLRTVGGDREADRPLGRPHRPGRAGGLAGPHKIEVGWELHRAFWGRGLATEGGRASVRYGFETVGLERIISVTMATNAASRRVMEKCGLRFQGELPWQGPWWPGTPSTGRIGRTPASGPRSHRQADLSWVAIGRVRQSGRVPPRTPRPRRTHRPRSNTTAQDTAARLDPR